MTPNRPSHRGTWLGARGLSWCVVAALAVGRPAPVGPAEIEQATARLVDAYRESRALPRLRHDTAVASIARSHSADMAAGRRSLGHDGFAARASEVDRRFPYAAVAENVAMNDYPEDRTAGVAVEGWVQSAPHRENILGDYDVTGIGVVRASDGTYYYTQIFVKRLR